MDLFFGASPVQKAVDAATSELLIGPDWTANVEIYEGINRSEDNGAEVLRCLARRMQHRNPQVISLALELLNACVSNCRERFHELVNQQPFLDEVVRVGLKGPSSQVRERALELILTWAEAFASKAHLANFAATYQRLRSQGTEFPARDMNAMAPVFTPAKHAQPQPQQQQQPQPALERARSHEDENQYSWVSPEYIAKVRSELQEVMNTVGIVKEMLVACETPQAARQNETLRSLLELLREMSNRLTRLIVEVEHEKLVDLCIQINEHVCVPLIWYKTIVSGHSYTPPNLPMPADLYDAPKSPAPAGTESKEHKSDAAPSDHRPAAQGEADDPQDEFEALAMRRQQEQKQAPVDEFEALALRDAPSGAGAASATNVDQQIKEFEDLLGLSGSGNPPVQ